MSALLRLFCLSLCLAAIPLAHGQTPWPGDAPEAWGLAIVDVETTGLEAGHHEMIDLGAIYTTVEGEELGRFFVRIAPNHPERASAIARSINGYDEARWETLGAVSPEEAAEQFLAFHTAMAGDRRFVFTAYNASFDRAFMDVWLNTHGSDFEALYTYFALDLPSMAWGLGVIDLYNPDVSEAFGIDPETRDPLEHTGLSGVEWNLELYRAMRAAAPNQDATP